MPCLPGLSDQNQCGVCSVMGKVKRSNCAHAMPVANRSVEIFAPANVISMLDVKYQMGKMVDASLTA